jgi:HK97 gp10 family phage protein
MDFSVSIQGLDQLLANTGAVAQAVTDEVNKALYASALHVEGVAKKSILNGEKSGRVYKRRTVTHQASAPGEAPASDTGRLVNSFSSYLDSSALTSFVIAGRGTVKYATMLEFGTSRIAPRPFMTPALEQSKDFINDRLTDAVIRATGKK